MRRRAALIGAGIEFGSDSLETFVKVNCLSMVMAVGAA